MARSKTTGGMPQIQTGSRGGKFHITASGNKSYTPLNPNSVHIVKGELTTGAELNAMAAKQGVGSHTEVTGYESEWGAAKKAGKKIAPPPKPAPSAKPVPPPKPVPVPKAELPPKPPPPVQAKAPVPPPAAQKRQQPGASPAGYVISGTPSQRDKVAIHTIVESSGLAGVLRSHPLDRISVGASAPGGSYWQPQGSRPLIAIPGYKDRTGPSPIPITPPEYPLARQGGRNVPMAHNVETPGASHDRRPGGPDGQARTLVHELGHHVHLTVLGEASPHDAEARRLHASAVARQDAVSKYALVNHKEYFAEVHTAYVWRNAELKEQRPEDYEFMRKARIAAGAEF